MKNLRRKKKKKILDEEICAVTLSHFAVQTIFERKATLCYPVHSSRHFNIVVRENSSCCEYLHDLKRKMANITLNTDTFISRIKKLYSAWKVCTQLIVTGIILCKLFT